jgi:hypothetical protein
MNLLFGAPVLKGEDWEIVTPARTARAVICLV